MTTFLLILTIFAIILFAVSFIAIIAYLIGLLE